MIRKITSVILVVVLVAMSSITAFAADATDLQLYMGIKPKYVYTESSQQATPNTEAGGASVDSPNYAFTTKDSDELVAQAISSNHPAITDGFIRQMPMSELSRMLTALKSASDILKERGRDDLLALAYIGGYIAPEHKIAVSGTGNVPGPITGIDASAGKPTWANDGNLGLFGDKAPYPLGGKLTLLSVFGERYVIGTSSYEMSDVVFDTTKDNKVYALINGYISYIGENTVEIMSYDQQVAITYRGVRPVDGAVAGSVFTQGSVLGSTSDFSVGIGLRVANVQRNILQIYTEAESKSMYDAWQAKYVDRSRQLVLAAGDTNYHIKASELPRDKASSYINPEAFGVKP